MIPVFNRRGVLPPGIHAADWNEFIQRFGGTARRRLLLTGLKDALQALSLAGCRLVYIDGSFVSEKQEPADYDACWDVQNVNVNAFDATFLDFSAGRRAQKKKYHGEFFPAQLPEGITRKTFLEFFNGIGTINRKESFRLI